MTKVVEARAAVLREFNQALAIEEVEIAALRPDEVLVRLVATGICHTDLIMIAGMMPAPLPLVLGHEGAGIVERVGGNVTTLLPGDHVILSFAQCGQCRSCEGGLPSYCAEFMPRNFGCSRADGTSAFGGPAAPHSHFFGQSSFGTYSVCAARNAIKVPDDAPLDVLAPLGCGFLTGAGAVLNALHVRAGDSIAVFGTGAVGLSAVMAARIAGAARIIAVDRLPHRLALALELGATDAIDTNAGHVADRLRALMPEGIDHTLDTTGVPDVIAVAIGALAVRGTCGLVAGVPGRNGVLPIGDLLSGGRSVRGIIAGDAVPGTLIPQLVAFHRQGRFPIEKLVSFYSFDEINAAIASAASGAVIKPVIRF